MKSALFFLALVVLVYGKPRVVQKGKEILKQLQEPRIVQRGKEILKSFGRQEPRIVQRGKEILKSLERQKPGARIVGGSDATIEEAPWQVCLLDDARHFCGGSLISEEWVVTAAHCVDAFINTPEMVVVGAGNNMYSNTERRQGQYIVIHPDYDGAGSGFPNDIGLIQLDSPFEFGETINKINLPDIGQDFDGDQCTITGWGRTNVGTGGPVSEILQKLDIPVIPNTLCAEEFADVIGGDINDGHICVLDQAGESACSGDSGGPLICSEGGQQLLAGATSWGISTCSGEFPSVYTRISHFREWIRENSEI